MHPQSQSDTRCDISAPAQPREPSNTPEKIMLNVASESKVPTVPAKLASDNSDAPLLDLRATFDIRARNYEAALHRHASAAPNSPGDLATQDAQAACDEIRSRMAAVPAQTLLGVAAKAHAFCWLELGGRGRFEDRSQVLYHDLKYLADSIMHDLLRLGADTAAPAQPRGLSLTQTPRLAIVESNSPATRGVEDPETVAILFKVNDYLASNAAAADGDLVALAQKFVPLAVTSDRAFALEYSLDDASLPERPWISAKVAAATAHAAVEPLAAAIIATPATTLVGLVAKAAVAAWAHSCDPVLDDGDGVNDAAASAHIVHDLLALADAGASIDHRAPPPGPDQKLLQLRHTFDQMIAVAPGIEREAAARYEALVASLPVPEGLRFRLDDAPMLKRVGLDFPAGGVYADEHERRLLTIAPEPADQYRRAREIFDAMAASRIALDQALAASGVQGPNDALEAILAPIDNVRDEMAEIIAYTLPGVAVKAYAACTAHDGATIIDAPHEGLVQSLLADLIALAGPPVAAGPSSAGTSDGVDGLSEAASRAA
jgi:hypothetical protein